jgi:hypothetical protein
MYLLFNKGKLQTSDYKVPLISVRNIMQNLN